MHARNATNGCIDITSSDRAQNGRYRLDRPIPAKHLTTRRHGYQRILLPLSLSLISVSVSLLTLSRNRTIVALRIGRQSRLYHGGPDWPCTHALYRASAATTAKASALDGLMSGVASRNVTSK